MLKRNQIQSMGKFIKRNLYLLLLFQKTEKKRNFSAVCSISQERVIFTFRNTLEVSEFSIAFYSIKIKEKPASNTAYTSIAARRSYGAYARPFSPIMKENKKMYFEINEKIKEVKINISKRESLLKEYQSISSKIQKLSNKKENYLALIDLNREHENILQKLKDNNLLKQIYLDLILEKENLIKKSEHKISNEIILVNQKIDENKKIVNQVSESLTAARELLNEILKLNRELRKARGFGIRDLFSGGLFSKHPKHSHITEAKSIITNIKRLSIRYQMELKNIEPKEDLEFKLNSFEKTVDIFINNFITESYILFKVNRILKKSIKYEEVFQKQIKTLETKETKLSLELDNLMLERIEMIEKI